MSGDDEISADSGDIAQPRGLLILIGLFLPVVAVIGYFVIALFLILPFAHVWLKPRPPRSPQPAETDK